MTVLKISKLQGNYNYKIELFSCLPKVDHVMKSCKEPIGPIGLLPM